MGASLGADSIRHGIIASLVALGIGGRVCSVLLPGVWDQCDDRHGSESDRFCSVRWLISARR